jgi:hypothetical protein
MIPDNKKISEIIRAKKKKMLEADPDLVNTDRQPDVNPNEMADIKMDAEIQSTLDSPEKIDAREKSLSVDDNMGLSDEEKTRMDRLRKYIDGMDLSEE